MIGCRILLASGFFSYIDGSFDMRDEVDTAVFLESRPDEDRQADEQRKLGLVFKSCFHFDARRYVPWNARLERPSECRDIIGR